MSVISAAAGTASFQLAQAKIVQEWLLPPQRLPYCDADASELRGHQTRPLSTQTIENAAMSAQQLLSTCAFLAGPSVRVAVLAECGTDDSTLRCYGFRTPEDVDLAWWRSATPHVIIQW